LSRIGLGIGGGNVLKERGLDDHPFDFVVRRSWSASIPGRDNGGFS